MRVSFADTKLHKIFVEKNKYIESEYNNYIRVNFKDGKRNRALEWLFLARVNLAYFILNRRTGDEMFNIPINTTVNEKLPYLDGAESELTKLPDPIFYIKKLLPYDVVSFDIFDTLIFRPLTSAKDTFMLIGERLEYFDFYNIRVAAERKARELSYVKCGSREVTIWDIYEQIERVTGIDAQIGVATEFNVEKELCFANPYMKRVFDLLIANGKQIIIVSDMYYTETMLKELLENCGYTGYDNLFVSCDYKTGKGGDGGIYKIVKQIYGQEKTYCHVGDNLNSDIKSAENNGFTALHYQNVNDAGNKYRATFSGMSELFGSAYGGIINTYLHNGLRRYSEAYEYGFIYGGFYVLGYCNWIYNYAKKNNIDKIFFLARDGDIYSRVFKKYHKDVSIEYVYWSRLPSIRINAKRNRYDYIVRFIRHRLNDVRPISISSVLKIMSLEFLEERLAEYNLRPHICLTKDNIGCMENLVIDNWDLILDSYEKEALAVKHYLESIIGDAKRIAVVDIGWAGSGPVAIKHLVEDTWKMKCKVSCLVAAAYSHHATTTLAQTMNGTVDSYIFNQMYNRNLKDYHINTNKHTNNLFFELFTQATSPTTEKIYEENGDLKIDFGFVEIENYSVVKEMHQGIADFADEYMKRFVDFPTMAKIDGYDAYIPFRHVTQDITLIKKVFNEFVITRNLGYDIETMQLGTINDWLEQKGL